MESQYKQLIDSLPKENGFVSELYQYEGFWVSPSLLRSIVACQSHFEAVGTDILIATPPKSGTTWLKALVFAIVNRQRHPPAAVKAHPLAAHNPHDLVPFLELKLYMSATAPTDVELSSFPSPRLFATHVPVGSLPASVLRCNSKIVYLCRDPRDTFVSFWHFLNEKSVVPLEDAFDAFCRGVSFFGPIWDHVLGYWKESLKEDSRALFFKYEDLKADARLWVKRLAEFLRCPFSEEEDKDGVVEMIVELCSFQNLSSLEANKHGKQYPAIDNKAYFRRGKVGDWVNYLTPEMAQRLDKIIKDKLRGSGLSL